MIAHRKKTEVSSSIMRVLVSDVHRKLSKLLSFNSFRLQIILSVVIGATFGGLVPLSVPTHPLVYASHTAELLEPRKAFEYSSSIHTADYANYAAVRSDNAGLAPTATTIIATAPVAAVPLLKVLPQSPPLLVAAAEPAPIVETIIEPVAALAVEKSQYHSQDSLGRAAYGHNEALQSHHAIQDAAGNKAGSYSHIAPDGRLLTTEYVADEHGYRVATNALPVDLNHSARRKRDIATTTTVHLNPYSGRVLTGHIVPVVHTAVLPVTHVSSYTYPVATHLNSYTTVL